MNLTIRQLGNSKGLILPPKMLSELHLSAGSTVSVETIDGRLVITPAIKPPPRYTLAELLAQCDPSAPMSDFEKTWDAMPPAGREIL